MADADTSQHDAIRTKLHELRQPLNVIRLSGGNIRARILPLLSPTEAAYLVAKLDAIDAESARAAQLAEHLALLALPTP